jgi:hypothetical protein
MTVALPARFRLTYYVELGHEWHKGNNLGRRDARLRASRICRKRREVPTANPIAARSRSLWAGARAAALIANCAA